jgi:ABC-type amino acid transport substrate-binding protein
VTRSTLRALLVLACALPCAALLAACGSSDTPNDAAAERTLQQTFGSSSTSIERGRLAATLRLEPEGLLKLGGPISVRLTGPFEAPSRRTLPRFDLAFLTTLAGQHFSGSAISTGTKGFLKLDDRTYAVDDAFVTKLRAGLGDAAAEPQAGLKALGIDPLRWITGPQSKGEERVAGVDTVRIGGDVDVSRLLADLGTLLDKAGGAGASLLTPQLRTQIAEAVKSAKVDVWTGAGDKLLRQLAVVVTFAFKDGSQSPIAGLEGGRITLRARLDDVNGAPVRVTAPQDARPLSELTGEGGMSRFLQGVGAGVTGGVGPGDDGAAFLRCITQAGGASAEIVRCASKLSP